MPTYEHKCCDATCGYEWEDIYGMAEEPPKICPNCNRETAKRLLSIPSPGIVQLYGDDLVNKVKADAKTLKQEMRTNENTLSNVVGESAYHEARTQVDKISKEFK